MFSACSIYIYWSATPQTPPQHQPTLSITLLSNSMMLNASTLSLVFGILSLGVTATSLGSEDTNTPSLNARAGICCALAQDNRYIQTVCQYMYESCGGWSQCVQGNDAQWCRYCVINHPEDPACLRLTWPPVDPAPVGRRELDKGTMAPLEELDSSKDDT